MALAVCVAAAGAAAACAGSSAHVAPSGRAKLADSAVVWTTVSTMAVGDTIQAGVWQRACRRGNCGGGELDVDSFAWSTPDSARIALGRMTVQRRRNTVARVTVAGLAPGQAVLSARRGSEWLDDVITVLPPVASLRWEPREVALAPGQTAVLRAVAWDSAGAPVAVVRWSEMWHRPDQFRSAIGYERLGDLLIVRGQEPGVACIRVILGHRSDTARVVVRPPDAAPSVPPPGCADRPTR